MTTITLTSENLHQLGTNNCGFTKAQIEALGFNWPPKKGWLKSLIGKTMSIEEYTRIYNLRYMNAGKLRRLKKEKAKHQPPQGFACY